MAFVGSFEQRVGGECEQHGLLRALVLDPADAPRELVAVHLGHLAIRDHERIAGLRRATLREKLERLQAIRGRVGRIAEVSELTNEQSAVGRMIVDDEDRLRRRVRRRFDQRGAREQRCDIGMRFRGTDLALLRHRRGDGQRQR